jgi:hypothetical protein
VLIGNKQAFQDNTKTTPSAQLNRLDASIGEASSLIYE